MGNLVSTITSDQLNQFFGASCGNVEHVRVASEHEVTLAFKQANTGQTFAFVQFEQQESAASAIQLSGELRAPARPRVCVKMVLSLSLMPLQLSVYFVFDP